MIKKTRIVLAMLIILSMLMPSWNDVNVQAAKNNMKAAQIRVTNSDFNGTFNIKKGSTKKVTTNISTKKLKWRSSNKTVVTVTKKGVIKGLKEGNAKITVQTADSKAKTSFKVIVSALLVNKTLSNKDVVNGKISLSNINYNNLKIDKSVGNAEITLNKVNVKGTLYMANKASYKVLAKGCNINKVVALEENAGIRSFAVDTAASNSTSESPTFIADKGTLVIEIDARGNVSIKQENTASIGTITVNRNMDGNLELNLEGYQGNLVVNSLSNADIAITTKNCNIPEASVEGTSSGQVLSLTDNSTDGNKSSIGKINVETNAKLKVDVPTSELVIADAANNASVTVNQPIKSIINNGEATELSVNSNIENVESKGEALNLKVAAGSTIKAVEASGDSSKIEVGLGSTINNVVSKGAKSEIIGTGKVDTVKVEGNDTKVNAPSASVSVAENVTGTTANGAAVAAGSTVNGKTDSSATGTSGNTSGGSTGGQTQPTGTKVVISDPGEIWSGKDVQMKADTANVKWSVYNDLDDTYGYATIDEETGMLHPYQTGTVRIVATSNTNKNVYGAVDVTILGKKFVRYEDVNPVILNEDNNLTDINDLEASGKLPKQIKLVYETGKGNETETINVDLDDNYWGGYYEGELVGNYNVSHYISVPSGYEMPKDFFVDVPVKVNKEQTDNHKVITGYKALPDITLNDDQHLVKVADVFSKFLNKKEVTLQCMDGSEVSAPIDSYFLEQGNQFNGAVPGSYIMSVRVQLPKGYTYRKLFTNNNSFVNWNNNYVMQIYVNVIVKAAQSKTEEAEDIPLTTQTKFVPTRKVASIESVTISNAPTEFTAGETVDFSKYLSVKTDTDLESDKRVMWSVDGNSGYDQVDAMKGIVYCNFAGKHTVTATSVVDKTKSATVEINVTNGKTIKTINKLNPITISEDLHIMGVNDLVSKLYVSFPRYITGTDDTGKSVRMTIDGWQSQVNAASGSSIKLTPSVIFPNGYNCTAGYPDLTINYTVPQTDNRMVVVSGSAIQSSITVTDDLGMVSDYRLKDTLFPQNDVKYNAVLADNSTALLDCVIDNCNITSENNNSYDGSKGNYKIRLFVELPEGYKNSNNEAVQEIDINLTINAAQTPIYENLWVIQKPKLTYNIGDTLDLSNLIVSVRDTTQQLTVSNTYIGYDKFKDYGIILKLNYDGPELTAGTKLTYDMNGLPIYIINSKNNNRICLGSLVITK